MSSFEKNEKNQAVITVEIDGGSFEKAVDAAYKKTASRYAVPGFRKGKAPRRLVEKYYGEAVFSRMLLMRPFRRLMRKQLKSLS